MSTIALFNVCYRALLLLGLRCKRRLLMRIDAIKEKQPDKGGKEATSRRLEVVQAALDVLANEGARGITHRAIDGYLKMPLGTTSNYFRRRNDLLSAVAVHIMERDVQDMREVLGALKDSEAISIEMAARQLTALFELWSRPENRTRALARLEISTESMRDRELSEVARVQIRRAESQFERIFERLGSRNPALSAAVLFRLWGGLHLLTPLVGEGPNGQTILSLIHQWLKVSMEIIAKGEVRKRLGRSAPAGGKS